MRRCVLLLLVLGALVAVAASSGNARARLPGVLRYPDGHQFVVRPSNIIIPGDGGWIIGGTKGSGTDEFHVGRIEWLGWTAHEATGIGMSWGRCLNVGGCPTNYVSDHDLGRFRLFAPADGHFTRIAWQGESGGFRLQRFGSGYIWTNY